MPRGVRRFGGKRGAGRPPGSKNRGGGSLAGYRNHLLQQREQIDNQLNAIDQIMMGMGSMRGGMGGRSVAGRAVGGNGRRGGGGPRAGSLKEFILRVLQKGGGIMSVKDITNGVVRSGYKSSNKTLAKSVGIALTELPSVHKVGRGQFRIG